ncbi:MAG: hypothetical protein EZS28_040639, partial [Streblomastix strix]
TQNENEAELDQEPKLQVIQEDEGGAI